MNRFFTVLCLFLAFTTLTSALYGSNSKVVKLTASNFKEKVIQSNELWFVEFFAPWCGHCKSLAPEYDKLAKGLDGIINVGAVDMTTDQQAGASYGIQGFPTIKFFGADKNKPVDYNGQRTASDMLNFAIDQAKKTADSRIRGGSSGGSSSGHGGSSGGSDRDVVVLTSSNFDQLMSSEDLWIVEFYAPWCGHCKKLEPEWNQAASQLKGEVKLAKVDATVEQSLASKYGINGYPTIKVFPAGPKSDNLVEDYQGGRDASTIVSYALEKKAQSKPVLKVLQLTNSEVFDKYCTNLKGACFIAFLPHIYDSSVVERNRYIEMFQELSKSNKANPVSFLWAQGGDYYDLEEKWGLGSGYPALVALSINKMKYAPFTGTFDKKNIESFVKNLISGKHPFFDLREAPKIKKVAEWDGKDKKPSYESVDL